MQVCIISAWKPPGAKRQQYEDNPRQGITMTQTTPQDDDMPAEIDFSGGKRGKLHQPARSCICRCTWSARCRTG